jgi:pSer/pThr/pTyr-binding forkhead associated (FHA) protein
MPHAHAERSQAAVCRLVAWGIEQRWLETGTYVIGREADCEVQVDVASLSRHHARLTVGPHQARVQDLKSKNGTFLNGERVGSADGLPLREGDELRLGSIVFSLHWSAAGRSTKTLAPVSGATPGKGEE